jgi:hypothetical protein
MVVKTVRLLHGAYGVSVSNLGLAVEVVYLYPHFLRNDWLLHLHPPW